MTHYIEDPYNELQYDEIFNDWYEIEGIRKIKELSRQLRTFFNYKAELIRYRFRSNILPVKNYKDPNFYTQKQEIESKTHEFISLLKNIKKNGQTLEQGIRSLYSNNNITRIKELSVITEKLSILIHAFSEESIHVHPRFIKFVVKLAQNIYLVKKNLYAQFSEFYNELELNYYSLEKELEVLLVKTQGVKNRKSKKHLEERLLS